MAALYDKCPKCGADPRGLEVCPKCAIVFAKYRDAQVLRQAAGELEEEEGGIARLRKLLFYVPEETNTIAVCFRAVVLVALAVYGVRLARMDVTDGEIGASLMHMPILIVHEAGHVVFGFFGEFMRNLGGALFQIALPLILGGFALVKTRDPFTAAVCFWWSAIAVIDTAPYVYDAYQPKLMLLTGTTGDHGAHDFVDVLGDLGLLMKAQPIGRGVHKFGIVMLVVAIAWGAYILWLQYRNRSQLD